MNKIINSITFLFKALVKTLTPYDPAFDFKHLDIETKQEGNLIYVEKGRHRIQIYEGELDFYKANNWKTV